MPSPGWVGRKSWKKKQIQKQKSWEESWKVEKLASNSKNFCPLSSENLLLKYSQQKRTVFQVGEICRYSRIVWHLLDLHFVKLHYDFSQKTRSWLCFHPVTIRITITTSPKKGTSRQPIGSWFLVCNLILTQIEEICKKKLGSSDNPPTHREESRQFQET